MAYHSQIGQDKWVESVLGPKKNGYFVELGACDGVYYSKNSMPLYTGIRME